ncbi:cell wall hydrolase [Rhizorhapis sp.]|uniref:cell wall hydrolase n=1 Tax=Rhizorhapis sp. TaxID=1968842 RepID=UPI002B46424F|nr:cell wall hydrolase [Rhizorhapis sp.]HKR17519.1 cell wall hydrolase [Rhizorhapis sp.]
MSFRLKAASMVAVAFSAVAALVATDPSLASGISDTASTIAVSSRALSTADALPAASAQETPVSIIHNADGSVTVTPRNANASIAQASPASSLVELVENQPLPETLDPEMQCLAGTVYFESKGESLAGQLAVARVVINRARSGEFPDSICGVVHQPSQFSFLRGGRIPEVKTSSRDWREAVAIAQIAMADAWNSEAEGALYFHARRVSPGWNRSRLAAIDNHIFYR